MAPTRDEIIARAMVWVRARVPYSMFKFRDGWRTDCSGLVSYAWQLDANYWTGNLARAGVRVPFGALQAGDMLLFHNPADPNVGSHVVLFERWTGRPGGDFWIIEQTGAGQRVTRRIMWSATRRTNLARYVPYRPARLATGQPIEGDDDMKLIIGNVKGRSTIFSGLRGVVPLHAHPGSEAESLDALAAAGAVRHEFATAAGLVGALGVLPDDPDGSASLAAVERAG